MIRLFKVRVGDLVVWSVFYFDFMFFYCFQNKTLRGFLLFCVVFISECFILGFINGVWGFLIQEFFKFLYVMRGFLGSWEGVGGQLDFRFERVEEKRIQVLVGVFGQDNWFILVCKWLFGIGFSVWYVYVFMCVVCLVDVRM